MFKLFGLLILTLTLSAAPLTFSLNGTMSNGSTFSGYFKLDGLTETVSDYSIQTQANGPLFSAHYSPSRPGASAGIGRDLDASGEFLVYFRFHEDDPSVTANLSVWFAGTPATFAGGNLLFYPTSCPSLACGPSLEFQWWSGTSPSRFVLAGSAEQIPEPATAYLLAGGLIAAIFAGRVVRRKPWA
jgi:hypothetical protein